MEDFIKERRRICDTCLLNCDNICNPRAYLNIETNTLSYIPKPGFKSGCGCYLPTKQADEYNHCPLNKW